MPLAVSSSFTSEMVPGFSSSLVTILEKVSYTLSIISLTLLPTVVIYRLLTPLSSRGLYTSSVL